MNYFFTYQFLLPALSARELCQGAPRPDSDTSTKLSVPVKQFHLVSYEKEVHSSGRNVMKT